jgi:hypothetical protein
MDLVSRSIFSAEAALMPQNALSRTARTIPALTSATIIAKLAKEGNGKMAAAFEQ